MLGIFHKRFLLVLLSKKERCLLCRVQAFHLGADQWSNGWGKAQRLDGKVSETPTMERPHPNCKCQQVECTEWDEFTEWEDVRELETINITMFSPIIIKGMPVPDVKWRKYNRAEEQRIKRHYVSCGEYGKGDSEAIEFRVKRKDVYRYSKAYVINTGYGIETGDRGWTHNPWTGETRWFEIN